MDGHDERDSKTPSPKPFREPENMITIDLKSDIKDEINQLEKNLRRVKHYTLLLRFGASISFATFLFLFVILLRQYGYISSITLPPLHQAQQISHNMSRCKSTQTFEDCCVAFINDKTLRKSCTVQKVLNAFLAYELQVNRHKRDAEPPQNLIDDFNQELVQPVREMVYDTIYDYHYPDDYNPSYYGTEQEAYQDPIVVNPVIQEAADLFQDLMNGGDIPNEEYFTNEGEPHVHIYSEENPATTMPEGWYPPATLLPKTCPDDGCPNLINASTKITNISNISGLPGHIKLDMDDTSIQLTTARNIALSIKTSPTIISASIGSLPPEPLVKAAEPPSSVCPTCQHVPGPRARMEQDNFGIKTKIDTFPPSENNNNGQKLAQNAPCSGPYSPELLFYRGASPGYASNQLYPIVPQPPLYIMGNPATYPFVPPQYASQYHNSYQSAMNPFFYQGSQRFPGAQFPPASAQFPPVSAQFPQTPQIAAPGMQLPAPAAAQFFLCNSIPSPSDTVASLPGVEIRRTSKHDILAAQSMVIMNNTRESKMQCPFGEQACGDGSRCISTRHLCDNEVNCDDASDELGCTCKERVGPSRLCDGYFDCADDEDEKSCFGCSENEFSCDDWSKFRKATCISLERRCDGIVDCDITGRDEEDCAILSDELGDVQNSISYTSGFLHRNYKGKWYPTCRGTEFWAVDVCKIEAGPSPIPPKSHMVPSQYKGQYINKISNVELKLDGSCMENRAAFVECPPLFCGLRMTVSNPFRATEVDTSAEDLMESFERQTKEEEVVGNARVVGGRPSQPGAWPWMVSIYKNGIFHCGGALISDLWVITAAHCVDKYWFFYYEFQIGTLRRLSFSPMEQNRFADVAIAHEAYNRKNLMNDIALMRLSQRVRFNRYVRPICLPSEMTAGLDFMHGPRPGTVCTTVGWGATVEHGSDPDNLREVEIPVMNTCKYREDLEGDEICAGLFEGGRDACQGDSGGPLVCRNVNNPSQWYLAGIVSHGEGCARPNEPGVYTKVAKYVGWISEKITSEKFGEKFPLKSCPGYSCQGTDKCLPKKRRCDKIVDCLFGDDEMDCWQSAHRFFGSARLGSPNVITELWHELFHGNKSDHKNSARKSAESVIEVIPQRVLDEIPEDYFRCKKLLQVIPADKKCDRIVHCEDGTDETDCLCVDYLRRSHKKAICDGITDCKDMSDEANCVECHSDQYFCRTSQKCIPSTSRCDGKADCRAEEDEWDCVALTNGRALALDADLRPEQGTKGIITINRSGVWRPLCTNTSDNATAAAAVAARAPASIAANICNLLGFEEYTLYRQLSVVDKPLDVSIEGFSERYLMNEESKDAVEKRTTRRLNERACRALFVACASLNGGGMLHANADNITREAELYTAPWNVVIYSDGKFRCTGTILGSSWIVTSAACFQGKLINFSYVAVIVGKGKAHLDVEGPHERTIQISGWLTVNRTDVTLLRTKTAIPFSRYIKPAKLSASRPSYSNETCIAIGIQNEKSETLRLKSNDANCTLGYRCFEIAKPNLCSLKHDDTWKGTITCFSRDGWYPAAVFSDCVSFSLPSHFTDVSFVARRIQEAMLNSDLQELKSVPNCDGFRCDLGQCIRRNQVCDGIPDCRSGEDEHTETCERKLDDCHLTQTCDCHWTELTCKNGKCIPKKNFCDGSNDCGDFSDEPDYCDCKSYLELTHPEQICDGIVNCRDRTDEDPQLCGCKSIEYGRCGRTSDLCVAEAMLCDGNEDCPNGEDEKRCDSLRTTTPASPNSGEVMKRTAGVWHSACFTSRNHTTSNLEEICAKLGFAGGSARQLAPPAGHHHQHQKAEENDDGGAAAAAADGEKAVMEQDTGKRPVMDGFDVVWIHRVGRNKLKLRMRTGREPYVRFVDDPNCHKLFIECL